GRHAALQQARRRERARKTAGVESADHARQCIEWLGIQRMLNCRDTLGFERFDRLGDLVAELDPADALVTPLDAGRLALNFDLEPDATDVCGLDGQPTGLAGDPGIRLVAANHRVERAVAADLLIDDDIDQNVALEPEAGIFQKLDRQNVARDAALHVAGVAPIETAFFHRRGPGIVAPAFAVTNRDYVGMAVEQHRAPAAGSLPRRDDIGAPLITAINRNIAGMLLERFPIRFPHVDLKVEL